MKIIYFIPALYCLSLPFEGISTFRIFSNSFQLPEAIFIGSLPFTFYFIVKENLIRKLQFSKLEISLVGYVFTVGVSFLFSTNSASLGELFGMGYFSIVFFCFTLLLVSQKSALVIYEQIFKIMIVIATYTSIFGMLFLAIGYPTRLVMFFEDYPIIGNVYRASGFLRNPILLADLLGIGMLVFLAQNQYKISSFFKDRWMVFITISVIIGLVLTLTKSILLIFGIGCFAYLKIHKKVHHFLKITIKVIAGLSIVLYLFTSHFFIKKVNSPELKIAMNSAYGGGVSYPISGTGFAILPSIYSIHKYACLIQFMEKPLFGIGGNCHIYDYHRLYSEGKVPIKSNMTPHSTYFGAIAEIGILGFFALLYFLFCVWKAIENLLLLKKITTTEYIGVLAIYWYILLQAITMDIMNIRHYWLLLVALSVFRIQVLSKSDSLID